MYMRKGFVIAVAVACVLSACNGGKDSGSLFDDEEVDEDSVEAFVGDTLHLFEEEEPPKAVDELFDDFFFDFADNPRFQKQRIHFPLVCNEQGTQTTLSRQEWESFNKFKNQELFAVIYERESDVALKKDTSVCQVGVEWIHLNKREDADTQNDFAACSVEKYHFQRLNGTWILSEINKCKSTDTPNGDFLHFYSKFASDSVFQRESLACPLKVNVEVREGEDGEDEGIGEIGPDDWFEMCKDMPLPKNELVNIDYGQSCLSNNRKTLLMMGVANGMEIKFHFDKVGSDWKLIGIDY